MRETESVANLVERDCPERAGVENASVTEVGREDDVAAPHPSVAVDAPDRIASLVVEVIGPAYLDLGIAGAIYEDEAERQSDGGPVPKGAADTLVEAEHATRLDP